MDYSDNTFDFLVIGGGTAGLVVAARLSEDPNIRVGVIEAGLSKLGDPNVDMPASVGRMLNNPDYDWTFHSIPQKGANNRVFHLPRGKLLGGSSAINFTTYVRPCAQDLDDWVSELGFQGWSFDDLLPYFKRHEHLEVEQPNIAERNTSDSSLDPELHGVDGPIHTSLATWQIPFEKPLLDTLGQVSGQPRPLDPYNGSHLGFYRSLLSIDRTAQPTRSYAASGFLVPALKRPNLRVLTDALATKIILESDQFGVPAARGVEIHQQGIIRQVFARTEVIVSAGSFKSPQLLELSGIGDPEVLERAQIQCVVPNPHVGNNLQEKTMSAVVYELGPEEMSLDSLFLDPNLAREHFGLYTTAGSGALSGTANLMGFVPFASQVSNTEMEKTLGTINSNKPTSPQDDSFQTNQYKVIAGRIRDAKSANIQLLGSPANFDISQGHADCSKLVHGPPAGSGRPCYALIASNMYPLSRGRVHIASSDPQDAPEIDPGFFTHPADAHVLGEAVALADRVLQSEHLKGKVGRRVDPPPEVDLQDADAAREFVRDRIVTYHHALGTCSMGLVVDERLRVKGVRGLRVVDASVLPMQVSAAIMATVYAAAEKGADLIKEDHGISM
ncbi:Oxygen-dependent choline dehydrogenase [Cytospora mali]|uniref:Oxygen-dependent choline dehydrogenase n=1 Tax=Cytospora mali TaxID=578113 RepID=A0A194V8G4_CYTMA|nr:Oxygen-dependent choline dehydrogenase [Valsa mali var. pyri (nom. inval.)]